MLDNLINENAGQINELKRKRRTAKNKVKGLTTRVGQLDKIRTKANNNFCDYAGQINTYISRTESYLASGLKRKTSVSTNVANMDEKKESTAAPNEYYISSAVDKMTNEINTNNNEIRTLNTQIYSYESKIQELGGKIMPWE